MAEPIDPWADVLLPRDRYGRPLIADPVTREAVPYQRASTFCSIISDSSGIAKWKLRHLAIAMGRYTDLGAMAAGLSYDTDKADLDEIIESALDRIGLNEKANYGTAVHTHTEPGRDPDNVPLEQMRADVNAYEQTRLALGIEAVETEVFTVNDDRQVAGTLDHIYEVPNALLPNAATIGVERLIGDKKTGTLHLYEHAVQLAVYAYGQRYNPVTGERSSLDVNLAYGLLWHIPRGEGRAIPYLIDLVKGWEACQMAAWTREYRKATPGEILLPVEQAPDPVLDAIEAAESRPALAELWRQHRDIWSRAYQDAAAKRALLFDELNARPLR